MIALYIFNSLVLFNILTILFRPVFSMGWQLYGTGHGHSHGGAAPAHGHGHSENMNVRAAFIHVLGDVVQSVGVFCAAIVIYFKPTWQLADPICTFIFSIIVLYTTVTILKDAILVSIHPSMQYGTLSLCKLRSATQCLVSTAEYSGQ